MLKTLAAKHKSSVKKMAARHRAKITTLHGPRTCYEARIERDGKQPLVARFGGIPLVRDKDAAITDRIPNRVPYPRKELVTRLLAERCELCGEPGEALGAPSPQPRQPRQTRASPAQVGGRHGQETAKDTRGLPPLPRPHPPRAARRRSGVDRWRATCTERCPRGSAGGRAEKDLPSRHLAARPTQWKAANSFLSHPGDPAARAWVRQQTAKILAGRHRDVRAGIRRRATTYGYSPAERAGADECAAYLENKQDYLDYPAFLAAGWPVASGLIEGAARLADQGPHGSHRRPLGPRQRRSRPV